MYIVRRRFDIISGITLAGKEVSLDYENADALVLLEGNTAMEFGRMESAWMTLYVHD